MKKILLAIAAATFLVSCTPKLYPIIGKYPEITIIKSAKPLDSVWSNIIDLFATKGISIKVIDKSSGLITSEKTSFKQHYSFENGVGVLENPNAWIVLNYYQHNNAMVELEPSQVTAEWNIRIKPDGKGCTVNVNLTNISAELHTPQSAYTPARDYIYEGKSTGVFEKIVSDLVK